MTIRTLSNLLIIGGSLATLIAGVLLGVWLAYDVRIISPAAWLFVAACSPFLVLMGIAARKNDDA